MKHQKIFKWNLMLFCLLLISLLGCKESDDEVSVSHDPSKPVSITSFMPESGKTNTQLIVHGSNFGNDKSMVKVKVGGKDATVISVKNDCLYCFVPAKGNGKVEVTVGEGNSAISEKDFRYEFKQVVSTLCGYVDELGYGPVLSEGKFEDLGKIEVPGFLSFDPMDNNILYCAQDGGQNSRKSILRFDLKNRYMTTAFRCGTSNIKRLITIDWDKNGDMLVSTPDHVNSSEAIGGILLSRSSGFIQSTNMIKMVQCISIMYNPDSDLIYYGSYNDGILYSYDYKTYGWMNNVDNQTFMFQFNDVLSVRFMIRHPSNKYMYIVVPAKHAIMRSDYDFVTKQYKTPYIVCGGSDAGYDDKVGVNAKMNSPWQGCFVKNPDYVSQGKEDEYDFYFVDRNNHCIRKLTPDGVVSTFAGRGSKNLNVHPYGYVDGEVREDARFNFPQGIAYDEKTNTFYVSDKNNYRIRKIAYETGDEEVPNTDESNNQETDNVEEDTND